MVGFYKNRLMLIASILLMSVFNSCKREDISVEPPIRIPLPPINLVATAVSSTQINLEWENVSTDEDGFYLYRKSENDTAWIVKDTLPNYINFHSDINLKSNTRYSYKIQGFNKAGKSDFSNIASARTLPAWETKQSGVTDTLFSVYNINSSTFITVGAGGNILRTNDCGNTWWKVANDLDPYISFYDVSFANDSIGVAVGAKFEQYIFTVVYQSVDGGQNWQLSEPNLFGYLMGLDFFSSNIGLAVGFDLDLFMGLILHTFDGGTSWKRIEFSGSHFLRSVKYLNSRNIIIVGDRGTILHSLDGGVNWLSRNSGTQSNLHNVTFVNEVIGFVVGDDGIILRTTNGGMNWSQQSSGTSKRLYDVCFTDVNTGTVVGSAGTILRTTDGGIMWLPQSVQVNNDLFGVCFINSNVGIVVGSEGIILKTSTGGW